MEHQLHSQKKTNMPIIMRKDDHMFILRPVYAIGQQLLLNLNYTGLESRF